MRERLPIYLGIFGVMALSNAIVPVLPSFAVGAALQSSVYAAYFLGAFLTVIPAGLLSDRVGRIPVIRAGLVTTVASGLMILALRDPLLVLAARGLEGIGAGLFVASAMSWMNTRPDHEHVSGDFMAFLNLGLVTGLLGAGWLAGSFGDERGGILAFTILSVLPAALVFFTRDTGSGIPVIRRDGSGVGPAIWMYLSAVILVGATGAVTAIYPAFTGAMPSFLGVSLAAMNLSTVITVVVASRLHLRPIPTIRAAAILLAAAVLAILYTPAAFVLVGALLGFIMIAQLAFLAESGLPQGVVMGSYNAASYLGMTLLPFVSGVVAERAGFLPSFALVACLAASMALVVGKSKAGHAS
jgi:hypothetical protein